MICSDLLSIDGPVIKGGGVTHTCVPAGNPTSVLILAFGKNESAR